MYVLYGFAVVGLLKQELGGNTCETMKTKTRLLDTAVLMACLLHEVVTALCHRAHHSRYLHVRSKAFHGTRFFEYSKTYRITNLDRWIALLCHVGVHLC